VSGISGAFEQIVRTHGSDVPLPGKGNTVRRFEALSTWAARDLSLARLAEGHLDALAILAEAGLPVTDLRASYGVWAARSRVGGVTARLGSDGWHLSGRKEFCSGSSLIDRALVTADTSGGYLLLDVTVSEHVRSVEPASWPAVGMADSQSETLEFGGPAVPRNRVVGGPGFTLSVRDSGLGQLELRRAGTGAPSDLWSTL